MIVVFIYSSGTPRESEGLGLRAIGKSLAGLRDTYVFYQQSDDDVSELVRKLHQTPVILIGHGEGGGKAVEAAKDLASYSLPVRHLILLDPVSITSRGFLNFSDFRISDNVEYTTCFHRHSFLSPWSLPVRYAVNGFTNVIRMIGHNEFPASTEIHDFIADTAKECIS